VPHTAAVPDEVDILLHLFNHQTHHRGQAHACLSILTGDEPPSLDLLVFQRGGTAPDLKTLIRQGRAGNKEAADAKWNETTEAIKAFNEARDKEKEPPS
jgi:hypothetical protein